MSKRILVTGGAGFIGSAVIRHILNHTNDTVLNIDKLTYTGNPVSLSGVKDSSRYKFSYCDICDSKALKAAIYAFQPNIIMHLAAESHAEKSIDKPQSFIETNVVGTASLLEAARQYFYALDENERALFRFHHISTDAIYGDTENPEDAFLESDPYQPNSPYSASKAASNHLINAWHRTYGLPAIISNSSSNYGPYQYHEQLIPSVICNAIAGRPIPVYNEGKQTRDWIYVEDHAKALYKVATEGKIGEAYNISSNTPKQDIDVVESICRILNDIRPPQSEDFSHYSELIHLIKGNTEKHCKRVASNHKITNSLNWHAEEDFNSGLRKTITWYLNNYEWLDSMQAISRTPQRKRNANMARLRQHAF